VKRTLNLLTSLIVAFVFVSSSPAEPVSWDIALEVGRVHLQAEQQFWRSKPSLAPQAVIAGQEYSILEIRELAADGKVLAYILDLNPGGCIVISSDTDIPPVIAYSFEGKFSMEDTPGNVFLHLVKWDMENRLEAIPITSEKLKEENNTLWENYLAQEETFLWQISSPGEWGPHLETTWSQQQPYTGVPAPEHDYNMYCPMDPVTGDRCVTGCGPTAMAQIINYWRYPNSVALTDSDRYTTKTRGIQIDGNYDTLDFPSFGELNTMLSHITYYDGNLYGGWTGSGWEYPTDIPEEAKQDIPALCFASGILFNYHKPEWGANTGVDYTSAATSASIIVQTTPNEPIDFPPLIDGFGYTSARAVSYSWSQFYANLEENMKNGEPAMLSIDAQEGGQGHIVVVDGFRDTGNYYHLNFGWGILNPDPVSDAWYILPEGMPDPGPPFKQYNVVSRGVIDISPPPEYRNDPPEITSTPITTATEDVLYAYDVNATDPDVGDVLTYSLTTSPAGMTINSATGLIQWTPTNAQVGNNAVVVQVQDQQGATDTQSFTITVANANDPPDITSTPVTTAVVDVLYTYDVNATDPDVGDVLTYSLTTSPAGMTINSATGLIQWTPTNAQVGNNAVVVQVQDQQGATDTQSFTITVAGVGALQLRQGWSIISTRLNPINPSPSSVFDAIEDDCAGVWAYYANPGGWKRYIPGGTANDLIAIEPGRGYLVNMTKARTLTIIGQEITDTDIELFPGWNLVGYNSSTSQSPESSLSDIDYTSVWTYVDGVWLRHIKGVDFLNTLTLLNSGVGYWICVESRGTWTVPP